MTSNGHERARPLRTGDPRELGEYRIQGRLGRGGMGTVYLAGDASGRQVAVKLIHPDLSDDEAFRRRFAREVESARRVARFSTAGVLDARFEDDPRYIVSEYVPGPNLSEAVEAEIRRDAGEGGTVTLERSGEVPGFTTEEGADGATNRMQVTCEENEDTESVAVRLWVNDSFVLETVDDDPLSGSGTALAVQRNGGGSGGDAIVHFDNHRLTEIDSGE